jgi:hypothetical protein
MILRVALTLYMSLVLAAGPGLCCCSVLPRLAAAEEECTPAEPCCGCRHHAAPVETPEPLRPAPNEDRCPCRAARLNLAPASAAAPELPDPAALSLTYLPTEEATLSAAEREAPPPAPFGERSAAWQSLRLRHRLRC